MIRLRILRATQGLSRRVVHCIFAFLSVVWIASAADEQGARALAQLRTYDKVYAASMTARGELLAPAPSNAPHLPPVSREWVFSRSGARLALIEDAGDLKPSYRPLDAQPSGGKAVPGLAFDSDNNMYMDLCTRNVLSFDGDRSAWLRVSTLFAVRSDGRLLSRRNTQTLLYGDADSTQLIVPINVVIWTLGRGYTPYLDEIVAVEEMDGGLLRLTASGSFDLRSNGRWTLVVDPNSQYLVTAAEFFPARAPSLLLVKMANQDVRAEGACVYPTAGECEVANLLYRIKIRDANLRSDESIIADARRFTDNAASEANTAVTDFRVHPPKVTYIPDRTAVDSTSNQELSNAPDARPGAFRRTLLVVNAVLLLIAVGLVVYFHWRKRHERT